MIITKRQHAAEAGLQKRLPGDIAACERLYQHWLTHVAEREAHRLVETVSDSGRPELVEAARVLALSGKVYTATVAGLGECGGVSCVWTRPLEPLPSDRPLASQLVLASDPLYGAPDRTETVKNLLGATAKQLTRWSALLEQVRPSVESGEFELPSYVEPEKPRVQADWNQPLDTRSMSERYLEACGRKWEDLNEYERAMLRDMGDMEASNESYLKERREG